MGAAGREPRLAHDRTGQPPPRTLTDPGLITESLRELLSQLQPKP
jgi:hypothetical protein